MTSCRNGVAESLSTGSSLVACIPGQRALPPQQHATHNAFCATVAEGNQSAVVRAPGTEDEDRRRVRDGVRILVGFEQHPAMFDLIDRRKNPLDADLESDDAIDDWARR